MEAMECVEEEERTDPMVEIVAVASEAVESFCFGEEVLKGEVFAGFGKSGIAFGSRGAGDDIDEHSSQYWV